MSEFWGYSGADTLAIVVIVFLSLLVLFHARSFVTKI